MSFFRFLLLLVISSFSVMASDELIFNRFSISYINTGGPFLDINTEGVQVEVRALVNDDLFVQGSVLRSTGRGWVDADHELSAHYDYDEARIGIGRRFVHSERAQLFVALDIFQRDHPDFEDCSSCLFINEYHGNDNKQGVVGHFGLYKRVGRSSFFHTGLMAYAGGRNEQHLYAKWEWPLFNTFALSLGLSLAHDGVAMGQLGMASSF